VISSFWSVHALKKKNCIFDLNRRHNNCMKFFEQFPYKINTLARGYMFSHSFLKNSFSSPPAPSACLNQKIP
ncbi:MAG: hypothetical protein KME55_37305, partial [Nostoc indistinguendum CM1-VF10]|nr:hypothetical protein [Nostoc indistinguendum CM1-VF10]